MKQNMKIMLIALFAGAMLLNVSCKSDAKFNDTVKILGSLPVFVTKERVKDTVYIDQDKVVIQIDDMGLGEMPDWADALTDYRWAPSFFIRKMLGNSIAVFTVSKTLGVEEGDPIEVFFKQMDQRNLSFEMRIRGNSIPFTTGDAKSYLQTIENDMEALFVPGIVSYVNAHNNILDDPEYGVSQIEKGFYCTDVTKEGSILYFNVNTYNMPHSELFKALKQEILKSSAAIILYCSVHQCEIGFRFKESGVTGIKEKADYNGTVPKMITSNEINDAADDFFKRIKDAENSQNN